MIFAWQTVDFYQSLEKSLTFSRKSWNQKMPIIKNFVSPQFVRRGWRYKNLHINNKIWRIIFTRQNTDFCHEPDKIPHFLAHKLKSKNAYNKKFCFAMIFAANDSTKIKNYAANIFAWQISDFYQSLSKSPTFSRNELQLKNAYCKKFSRHDFLARMAA